jgi:hypothetical protein
MAATWTIARGADRCGGPCGGTIAAGDLLLEIRLAGVKVGTPPKLRCQSCGALFAPLTDEAIARAQAAWVDVREREALHQAAAPVIRHRLVRTPQSWASMQESAGKLFDFGKAAAGDRE